MFLEKDKTALKVHSEIGGPWIPEAVVMDISVEV